MIMLKWAEIEMTRKRKRNKMMREIITISIIMLLVSSKINRDMLK